MAFIALAFRSAMTNLSGAEMADRDNFPTKQVYFPNRQG
jgi:hypothetical protein